MITEQIFNLIPDQLCKNLLDYYNSLDSYDTETMNKAPPGDFMNDVIRLLEEKLRKKLEYTQGNFYKHNIPYLPHTDYKTWMDGTINVVIPLEIYGQTPHLIIFDQIWNLDSVTWCMHLPVQYFTSNIGVKGCPYEYPVKNLTGESIDDNFYKNHLSMYPKETLFGLSGNAFPCQTKSAIIFDNKKIHCTSKMRCEKTALTLRFK